MYRKKKDSLSTQHHLTAAAMRRNTNGTVLIPGNTKIRLQEGELERWPNLDKEVYGMFNPYLNMLDYWR